MTKRRFLSVLLVLSFLLPSNFSPIQAQPSESPGFAPVPSITLDVPEKVLIGEAFSFSATFDNASASDVGYGPYIDIFLPQSGADDSAGGLKQDGIIYTSADYLGNTLQTWTYTCAENGTLTHPLTNLMVTCPPAPPGTATPFTWQVLVVELPFGSFAPDQPAAMVNVSAKLSDYADLDVNLPIYVQGGYRFGADALDNPAIDPPIIGARSSSDVSPSLLILNKAYVGPEDETSTGPNYPRHYTMTVNIPESQTITDLVLTDSLPDNMQFIAVDSTNPAITGCTTPSTTIPGGTLSCTFASLTGTSSDIDASVSFSFYIPLKDNTGVNVIDPLTGGCVTSENAVSATANWLPLDPRDPATPTSASKDPAHLLKDCSHTIQKYQEIVDDHNASSYSPGDVIEYRLEFQVSDFFAEDTFTVWDIISDGQHFDPSFIPTLAVNGNTYAFTEANFNPANYTVVPDYTPASPPPNTGTTAITFYISNEIVTRGEPNGRLIGGCVPTGGSGVKEPDCALYNDGPTTGVIRFRTIIQDYFTDNYPSGEPSIDEGDLLSNDVTETGIVLNNGDLSTTGNIAEEGSGTSFEIPYGTLEKSIYAINGSTSFSSPVRLTPKDTITYRLKYNLTTSDEEKLKFTDFLPLPVLDADELTVVDDVISAAIPADGHVKFGPDDTFRNYSGIVPTLSIDSVNNSFSLFYGNFHSPLHTPTTVDLLFTVTVSTNPFADGLYLTNQAEVLEGSTNHGFLSETAIIQFILEEPEVSITKGAVRSDRNDAVYTPTPPSPVAFNAPGEGCPRFGSAITSAILTAGSITSNISQVDAADLVTFAIVLENKGHADAFEVAVKDNLPAGYIVPAGGLNLCVTNGAMVPLPYTDLSGGLLGSGIQLDDTGGSASLKPGLDSTNVQNPTGDNLTVITFDLQLADTVNSSSKITNTATLTSYTGATGGANFIPSGMTDSVDTTIRLPQSAKILVSTNQPHTSGANVAIGEIATYNLTITVPEGITTNAFLTDTLPAGLAFVNCDGITASSGDLTTDLPGGFTAACDDPVNPTVLNSGGLVQFTLGNLTNSNTDNAIAETLTVQFSAVALNITSNQQGTQLSNSAVFSWDGGTQTSSPVVVNIVEPAITVNKTALPVTGDAGDLITYSITINNPADSIGAFNMTLDDIVPAELTYTPLSFQFISGLVPDALAETPDLNADWASFPAGSSSTLRFTGTLKISVSPGDRITNDAIVKFTSLPGLPGQQSPYNLVSFERTGNQSDPGGTANDYTITDPAFVDVNIPTPIKYLVASSESHTTGINAAIGEIVRFRLSSVIPEGTSTNFQIRDLLPAGFLYLDDGTAKLAFVSNGAGITSSNITCANVNGASGDPSVTLSAQIDCDFPVGAITNAGSGNPFSPGNDPWFNFGNLINSDSDPDKEYIIAEFNALVVNSNGNQAGTNLSNDFRVYVGGAQVADATNLTIVVIEPALTINKTVSAGPYDAGDEITYSVVISASSAANTAAAYDLIFDDAVNAALQVQNHSILAPGYATTSDGSSGNTIHYDISRLNPGDSATVTITALIPASAPAYLTIPNTAGVLYTSLPGANGTTPNDTGSINSGLPGTQNGERTGQDGAGGLNDYAAQDTQTITLKQPSIEKRNPSLLTYTIGETVTYPILVTLPEGITRGLEVTDNLPNGLEYVSSQVITTAADSGGLLTLDFAGGALTPTITAPGGSGVDATWAFGDITNLVDAPIPEPDNDRFLILITARVMNASENNGGDTLDNSALLRFTNPNSDLPETINTPPVTITLVEPVMGITKVFNPNQAAINETVQVTLVVSNTGTSPAYDVIIEDPFPIAQFQSTTQITTPADFIYESLIAGSNLTVRYSGGPIEAGGSRTFVFNVTANAGFIGGSDFNNTATITQATTLAGASAYERDEPDVSASDLLNGISPDLVLTKNDGRSEATAGDTLIYTVTINNVGLHDSVNLTVSDTTPEGTVSDSANSTPGWSCPDGSPAGTVCTLEIAGLASGAQTTVAFAVRVDNPLSGNITQITNTASVADDGTFGPDPTPDNNSASDTDTLAATAPDLIVEKVDALWVDVNANNMPSAGDTIRYTTTITNNGNQGAGVAVFTDMPGANTTLVSGSVTSSQGTVIHGNALGDLSVSVDLGEIPGAGGRATVQFNVTIDDPLPPDVSFVENQGLISGRNFVSVLSDDPDYPGNIDPTITLLDNSLLKTLVSTDQAFTDTTDVAIGEIVEYEVRFNVPPGETRLTSLRDKLDQGLAFIGCVSITPSSSNLTTDLAGGFDSACTSPTVTAELPASLEPADQGRDITFNFGNLTNSANVFETLVIRYQAIVLDSLANQDGKSLNNHVTMEFLGGLLSSSAGPVKVVEPDLVVSKDANRHTAINGALVTFTLRVRYTVFSTTDAFDLVMTDTIPIQLAYKPGTFVQVSGPPAVLNDSDPTSLIASWATIPFGAAEAVFEFQANVHGLSEVGNASNEVSLIWSSLPGDISNARSVYNILSTERFFDPLSNINVYGVNDFLTIRAPAPSPTSTPTAAPTIGPKPTLPATK
jgi:uncharacterized repeat protein (TIGR01451 family)/fimbrial isopeptide formation D2 family protein